MNFRNFLITNNETLSEICRDIAQVFFGAMVVGQIMDKLPVNWILFLIGVILALFSWITSVIIK